MKNTPVIVLLAIGLIGCPEDPDATGTRDAGSTVRDGGTADRDAGATRDGGGVRDGGSDERDAGVFEKPPAATACAIPTLTTGGSITNGGETVTSPSISWNGSEGAVAYATRAGVDTWAIRVQRIDGMGALTEAPVEVGTVAAAFPPTIAVSSGPGMHMVCYALRPAGAAWETMSCASVPLVSGPAQLGDDFPSAGFPAMAYGGGGHVVVYREASGAIAQTLTAQARRTSMSYPIVSGDVGALDVSATASGYVVALSPPGVGPAIVKLESSGSPLPTVTSLRGPAGSHPQVAVASRDGIAGATWVDGMGQPVLSVVDLQNNVTGPTVLSDAADSYGQVSIAEASDGFAPTWSDFFGFIGYRAVDRTGGTTGEIQQVYSVQWDENPHDVVSVADGFLLATTVGISYESLDIVHLACP